MEHGAHGVPNGMVRMLDGAILMRVTWGSMFNVIPCILEEVEYLLAFTKITTRIKSNILILDFSRWAVFRKPHVEKVNRGALLTKYLPCSIPV